MHWNLRLLSPKRGRGFDFIQSTRMCRSNVFRRDVGTMLNAFPIFSPCPLPDTSVGNIKRICGYQRCKCWFVFQIPPLNVISLNSQPLLLLLPQFSHFISSRVFLTGKRNHRVFPEGATGWRDHPRAALDSLLPPRASPQTNQPLHQPTRPAQTAGHACHFYPAAHWRQGLHLSGRQAGQQRASGRQPNRDPDWYTWRSVPTDDRQLK